MAKGMNKVFLLGHAGKAPEIRSTQNGVTVANFSLATADRQKQGEEWVDKTEWHNIVAFKRTAEVIRDYVKKGSKVMIEGRIQTRSWDDKDSGQKKYRTEIIVNDLTLLGDSQGSENGNGSSRSQILRPMERRRVVIPIPEARAPTTSTSMGISRFKTLTFHFERAEKLLRSFACVDSFVCFTDSDVPFARGALPRERLFCFALRPLQRSTTWPESILKGLFHAT